MRSWRENPEGEENQRASNQADLEIFALKMMHAATVRKSRKDGYCDECGMLTSQCECWDSVNGGN